MEQIKNFVLPEHTNRLYQEEAISSIGLTRDIAAKINELVDAYNELSQIDLEWKQAQEGAIRKGILYMKDNLLIALRDLLKIYDNDAIKNAMLEVYGAELDKMRVFVTPQMFGAVGDGSANDIDAIEAAIAALGEGGVLFFPNGVYRMEGRPVDINRPNVTFAGNGLIRCDFGFRPKASNFKAVGLYMEGTTLSNDCRAFWINNPAEEGKEPTYLENFSFKDCAFINFFYAIAAVGGAYNHDGTEEEIGYPVRDVVIENCYSSTYEDQNVGHFQCIQVENISYINNRTYGGTTASSYNAIKGNGFIRVVGNYDHNNKYASCELENGSGKAVVANNTFGGKIWIDDSFDVVVNANVTTEGILITVGSGVGDANNVVVSNNTCRNIRCEQFGTYNGGIINNVNIIGNNVAGDNTHGIWLHGNAVKNARVSNNFITGTNTNDIAVQRNAQLVCYVSGNFGNGKTVLIAGSGGTVFAIDNFNVNVSGVRDSLPASHYEREFNGIRLTSSDGTPYRVNVSDSGNVYTTAY